MRNDLQITHWERQLKNKVRELSDAIRDKPEWIVATKARELVYFANEINYRALAVGFEKHPPLYTREAP